MVHKDMVLEFCISHIIPALLLLLLLLLLVWIAQSVSGLDTGWTTEGSQFESQEGQGFSIL
jgi:hypothetical protein